MSWHILLPHSEGKAPGGDGPPWTEAGLILPELDRARRQVARAWGRPGRESLVAPTLPAAQRFTGVLYRELSVDTLRAPARKRLLARGLVFTGPFGVVALGDPIPDYRLKLSASVPKLGKLSTWWRPQLTPALRPLLEAEVVWDLLPIEHSAAWRPDEIAMKRRVTVRFVDQAGKTITHWNKLLKGALVRHIAEHQPAGPEDLADFVHPLGYRFDPSASDLDGVVAHVVFTEQR